MDELAPCPSQPFQPIPSGLVSLWDMMSERAGDFIDLQYEICRIFNAIDTAIARDPDAIDLELGSANSSRQGFLNMVIPSVFRTEELATRLCVRTTLFAANDFRTLLLGESLTLRAVKAGLEDVAKSLSRDMRGVEFLVVDPNDREFYNGPSREFLEKMDKNFDGASFNFVEAGRCLAMDRHTACVMHVGRAIEPALQVVADRLGVETGEGKSWGVVLREIRTAIGVRDKGEETKWSSKDERMAFHAIAQHFWSLKVAVRDPATHKSSLKYTRDEAKNQYDTAIAFMNDVAKHLSTDEA